MTTIEKIKAEFIYHYPKNYANEPELGGRSCVFSLYEVLQIIDKYAEQEPTDEWQNGYDMAWEEAKVFYEQEPCDDAVSRQAVLDVVEREPYKGDALSEIEKLPSVRPQEKTGKWKFVCQHWRKCSECGFSHKFAEDWEYCPNCGARMVKPQESEVSE